MPRPDFAAAPDRQSMRTYAMFGLSIRSDFAFRTPLRESAAPPDIEFTCTNDAPDDDVAPSGLPAFESAIRLESGAPFMAIHEADGCDVVRFSEVADFHLRDSRIDCHVLDPEYAYVVELRLIGPVLAYWLERRGMPVLHASAVVVDGRAVVFMATNQGGKSSLAAELVRAGHALLTDDVLGVELHGGRVVGRPGYPAMRLWPEQSAHFVANPHRLELVHPHFTKHRLPVGEGDFGRFHDAHAPVGAIFLPERRDPALDGGRVSIIPLSASRATFELARASFLPDVVGRPQMAAPRLPRLARVAAGVPVARLLYPDGMDRLADVCDEIVAGLERLDPTGAGAPR